MTDTIFDFEPPSGLMLRVQKRYDWKPKEDITAYELALCVPVMLSNGGWGLECMIEALPESARRHFEVQDE
jgi:hypothetical protein